MERSSFFAISVTLEYSAGINRIGMGLLVITPLGARRGCFKLVGM